ncbi:MAG TPA: InlB B-repeat-containing protein [Candidatus Caccovivens faecavium]|nr:InlB B-repeat-containing protein [Candidatus Caccovivens faecavium]
MSAHYWDPIGKLPDYFSGFYNGGKYTVRGLFINNVIEAGQGLFGYVYDVYISNVIVIDAYIRAYGAGGIVGTIYGGTVNIYLCSFSGNIVCDTKENDDDYVSLGGIVSANTISNEFSLIIDSCYNNANIFNYCNISRNFYGIGGIFGNISGGLSASISNCYNTGNIVSYSSDVVYGAWIAGIAARVRLTNNYIRNCYNLGDISATKGTVAGIAVATIMSGCGVVNCWNFGNVMAGETYGYAIYYTSSAISSNTTQGYVRNCYWGGNCLSSEVASDFYAIVSNCAQTNSENPKTLSWYTKSSNWYGSYQWNFSSTWTFVEGLNNGYPVLINNQQTTRITYHLNYGTDEIFIDYKTEDVYEIASDIFTRDGYLLNNWNTEADGTGDVYEKGDVYTGNGDLELYAQWILPIYEITLDWGGIVGGTPNTIYQWYGNAYYCEESCINEISSLTFPTNNGFTFRGFYTGLNGTGMQVVNSSGQFLTYTTEYHSWHAYFVANNPAYYDSGGGYWYVENGMIPQSKVTGSLKTTLNSQWNSLSNGSTYVMGVQSFTSKVYNGNEYCLYNNEYYLVEPIRWRLQANSSQKTGYGTTTDTLAVMDTIVYLGRYSTTEINAGSGYSSTAVDYLYNTLNSENNGMDSTYLVNWTQSMPTFGTTSLNGTAQNVTARVFVSSIDEINTVAGSGKVKFSDLVKDYLKSTGNGMLYYTRDLGTNYNNIICLNENGDRTQRKPNLTANRLGVQFTIKVTEYACVEG